MSEAGRDERVIEMTGTLAFVFAMMALLPGMVGVFWCLDWRYGVGFAGAILLTYTGLTIAMRDRSRSR